ncbi:hypothetical protein AVEN_155523-1 [Araneus ventricosus]|uniref:Uncharacterized protein n=1 Tax=Araneus ventricosus TaxID=182803 RepID=A0A4Y2HUK9_ARAVE|nr:hypothetical protein AVEN_155523-1 [Araneus ventricosus]
MTEADQISYIKVYCQSCQAIMDPYLEVENNDVNELLDSHSKELTNNKLIKEPDPITTIEANTSDPDQPEMQMTRQASRVTSKLKEGYEFWRQETLTRNTFQVQGNE